MDQGLDHALIEDTSKGGKIYCFLGTQTSSCPEWVHLGQEEDSVEATEEEEDTVMSNAFAPNRGVNGRS